MMIHNNNILDQSAISGIKEHRYQQPKLIFCVLCVGKITQWVKWYN